MINLSLCIEPLFKAYAMADRIKLAADAGYKAVEFWDPSGKDLQQMASVAVSNNVQFAACTLSEPRKFPLDKSSDLVTENVRRSIEIAQEIDCPTMIGLSSDISGRSDSQKNILIENLKRIADLLVKADKTLIIEALNSLVNHKGYYLDNSAVAFEIVKCVNCPNIKVLYDVYHMQIMEGNLVSNITEHIEWIGHFHTAGVPGRHEPINNEIDYPYIMKQIRLLEYKHYVGLEYWPTYDERESIEDSYRHLSGETH